MDSDFHLPLSQHESLAANTPSAAITVVSGIGGTLLGAAGGLPSKTESKGYFLVSAAGFFPEPAVQPSCNPDDRSVDCMIAVFFAECLLFFNTGPLNTIIVNVSNPLYRATAFALNIFIIHALGDAVSPSVIGWLSDLMNLRAALLIAPLFILVALIFCLCGCRFIDEDMADANVARE